MLSDSKMHGFLSLLKHFTFDNNELIIQWNLIDESTLLQLESYTQSELTDDEKQIMNLIPVCLDLLHGSIRRRVTISPDRTGRQ